MNERVGHIGDGPSYCTIAMPKSTAANYNQKRIFPSGPWEHFPVIKEGKRRPVSSIPFILCKEWLEESHSLIFNCVIHISVWYLNLLCGCLGSKEQLKPHRLINGIYAGSYFPRTSWQQSVMLCEWFNQRLELWKWRYYVDHDHVLFSLAATIQIKMPTEPGSKHRMPFALGRSFTGTCLF